MLSSRPGAAVPAAALPDPDRECTPPQKLPSVDTGYWVKLQGSTQGTHAGQTLLGRVWAVHVCVHISDA